MKIGINLLAPQQLPLIKNLYAQGQIDFCEIILDNFVHLPAKEILSALGSMPIAVHLVASRFLEKSEEELVALSAVLRSLLAELNPLYVSDHLAQFTRAALRLPFALECDYAHQETFMLARTKLWQHLLKCKLYLENYASMTMPGKAQVNFFQQLLQKPDLGLLFDISNAYIAQINQICAVSSWQPLAFNCKHLHVAGFSQDAASGLFLDTHDEVLADAVLLLLRQYRQADTLVIEFDKKMREEIVQVEMQRVRACLS